MRTLSFATLTAILCVGAAMSAAGDGMDHVRLAQEAHLAKQEAAVRRLEAERARWAYEQERERAHARLEAEAITYSSPHASTKAASSAAAMCPVSVPSPAPYSPVATSQQGSRLADVVTLRNTGASSRNEARSSSDSFLATSETRDAYAPAHPTLAGFSATTPPIRVHALPFLPAASATSPGILRLVNRNARAGVVELTAFDDMGHTFGPVTLWMAASQTVELGSADIEQGNPLRGLPEGVGTTAGDWRLEVSSTLDLDLHAYAVAPDGLRSALHDTVQPAQGRHRIALFPGPNAAAEGRLRLVNAASASAQVTIEGFDNHGTRAARMHLTLPPGRSRWIAAADLAAAAPELAGAVDAATEHWRLTVRSSSPIEVLPFSTGAGGELVNLAGEGGFAPPTTPLESARPPHAVWLFPEAGADAHGILRLINRSAESGTVAITARDDSGRSHGTATLEISPGAAASLTRSDLEHGNAAKGLSGRLDGGQGPWRLELRSVLDLQVGSYVESRDGVIAPLHGLARRPGASNRHEIAWLPGDSGGATGLLRLVNREPTPARVRIRGVDDEGKASQAANLSLPSHGARTLTSSDLQWGAAELDGWLGAGAGQWRLSVWADGPVEVMALHSSVTGRITNVSATQAEPTLRGAPSPIGDLNGDGKDDVLLRHVDGRWAYYPMDGRVPIEPQPGIVELDNDLHWRLAGLGDFDGDGKDDVLLRHTDGRWQGYLMDGATVRSSGIVELPADAEWSLAAIGDLDGDGRDEPLLRHDDGRWELAPLRGLVVAASGSAELTITNNAKWRFAGLGDLNGDGNDDIVLRHQDGRWHYYAMNGSEALAERGRLQLIANLAWRLAAIGDINGDGKDDVLLRQVNGRWRYYAMSGTNVLAASGSLGMTPNLQWDIVGLADFNGTAADDVLLRHEDGRWFLYPWSEGAVLGDSGMARLTADLAWSTTGPEPPLDSGTRPHDTNTDGSATADQVFASSVSTQVVQAKCIACHVAGGQSASTRLVLVRSTAPDHVNANRQIFEDFVRDVDDGANVILNKVQGASGHGGGTQLIAGSAEFESLRRFVALLDRPGTGGPSITPANLFDGVRTEPARSTLRRAALVFAGRNPTQAEYDAIQSGGRASLRAVIRGFMQGPEFHEFLTRAANDRLLTDREYWVIGDFNNPFVEYVNERHRLASEAGSTGAPEVWAWDRAVQWGAKRAPLELIAHVAQNDLPYTDILTAPYIMANPQAARAYGSTTDFGGSDDPHEFHPVEISSYYRRCEGMEVDRDGEFGPRVSDPGPCATDFPHAGLLNTKVFLQRYPTTATNRNRARSRWTYYHFLGFDIEASAARTTEPDALADTDNPTLRNPACTVCHTVLDPVAGAFQDYGNEGLYRNSFGGMDALDGTYKFDSPVRFQVTAVSWEERETVTVPLGTLDSGRQELELKHLFSDQHISDVVVDRLALRGANGALVASFEAESLARDGNCYEFSRAGEAVGVYIYSRRCVLAFDLRHSGAYTVDLVVHKGVTLDCGVEGPRCAIVDASEGPPGQYALRINDFYREGDTWYRGMRAPGFADAEPRKGKDTMVWLASKIAADSRFAESVVKFWWPAIMGSEVAPPPQAANDATFAVQLLRANAQSLEVTRLAEAFRRGIGGGRPYNLKDLLVEITLSKWFRAHSLEGGNRLQRAALEGAGARRLLTPEELARKTDALTGFRWGRWRQYDSYPGQETTDSLTGDYRLLYGGIDSDGVTERSTDITSVMLAVAESHAVESSCPIVLRELFLLDDGQRRLFNGIDEDVDPTTAAGEATVRDQLVRLYQLMMGVELGPRSRDVNTAFDLFARVWRGKSAGFPSGQTGEWLFNDRSCVYWVDVNFFDGILEDAVVLKEYEYTDSRGNEVTSYYYSFDWDHVQEHIREVFPRDTGGAAAWIVVLAYLMTDYRYLYL